MASTSQANFRNLAFAPDSNTGYLVGYQGTNTNPMVLKSSDGGATWSNISSGLSGVVQPGNKLMSIFALDAVNVWVGGDHGILVYSGSGGR